MSTELASSPAATSHVSPRDMMRLAKVALMEDEDKEVEVAKERRKIRRGSHVGGLLAVPGSPSSFWCSVSPAGGPAPSPPSSIRSVKPILRRPSNFDSPSLESLSLSSQGDLPSVSSSPRLSPDFNPSGIDGYVDSRKRTLSKVRFSEHHLPPANSSPLASPSSDPGAESALLLSPAPARPTIRRESSVEGLRRDLALTARTMSLARRASSASLASDVTDPFPYSDSPMSRLSAITDDTDDGGFAPQTLRYPKVPRTLSGHSVGTSALSPSENSNSSNRSSKSADTPELRDLLNRPSLMGSSSLGIRPSFAHSASGPSESSTRSSQQSDAPPLRALLDRPSLAISPPVCIHPSYASSTSALEDAAEEEARWSTLPSTSASLREVLDRPSLASAAIPPRPSKALSIPSSNPRASFQSITSTMLFDAPTSAAPGPSLLDAPARDAVPKINRKEWCDPDRGLSPRSGPSPLIAEKETMDDVQKLDPGSPSLLQPEGEDLWEKNHRRTESTLSEVLSFPIPPAREPTLDVWINHTDLSRDQADVKGSRHRHALSAVPTIGPLVQMTEISLDSPRPDEDSAASEGLITPLEQNEAAYRTESPDLDVGMRRFPKRDRARRMSTGSAGETDESDLDIRGPLISVALKSNILSPNSRLLHTSSSRPSMDRRLSSLSVASLRSGVSLTSGLGWSGSESEEDEFMSAIRNISMRKLSATRHATPTSRYRAVQQDVRQSVIKDLSRFSHTSDASELSISTISSDGPLTPITTIGILRPTYVSRSSSSSSIPGQFAWGGSAPPSPTPLTGKRSPRDSPSIPGIYKSMSASSISSKQQTLFPFPTRHIAGWGPPEVLVDDDESIFSAASFIDVPGSPPYVEQRRCSTCTAGTVTPHLGWGVSDITPIPRKQSKIPDQLTIETEDEGWLMDEKMPGMMMVEPLRRSRNPRFANMPMI